MGAELIPMAFSTGWGSGINAYLVVLVLGLADRVFGVSQIPDALARTDVLIGAGILFAIEMVADKIPYVDSVWDSVHTVVRPAVGATIGYLIGHETASLDAAIGAATGGITALISHGIKAGLRAAVNTSPEPASNIVVSTTEDVAVTGVTALTIAHPWLAATIAFVLLLLGGFIVYKVAGRIRRYKRRYDAWGERMGISTPTTTTSTTTSSTTPTTRRPPGRSGDPGLDQGSDPPHLASGRPPRADEGRERPFDQES
ncbi:uncharacterized protein DUF4126 [Humibacillus xanthopallidus]|uniref:Uncharacterized protein DUF4126 n=1 Tax=Humibacillus xanthopallidus TaxID=412689 RepID=A0A543PU27_9MICO|nr:DUF4126 domain-containing protein [Humibacillus xanthopallidus]TQN47582.1 uncharacterized protein DUF4126 [Humibacillus xanthopallidus]